MNVDDPPRVIVVTSARPRDGKSTTAANLAAAISLSGQPVTLVDGDLRRPSVADKLGLVEGAGLTDVLIGQVDLDDVLQEHARFSNLRVLAAGSTPPNPSELLGSHAMQALLKELGEHGIVIVDAPPLLPVTDAAVLTRNCDGAIIVVSHGLTLDNELDECLRQLTAVKGTVLGVVFNRMPRRGSTYYAGGSYYGVDDTDSGTDLTLEARTPHLAAHQPAAASALRAEPQRGRASTATCWSTRALIRSATSPCTWGDCPIGSGTSTAPAAWERERAAAATRSGASARSGTAAQTAANSPIVNVRRIIRGERPSTAVRRSLVIVSTRSALSITWLVATCEAKPSGSPPSRISSAAACASIGWPAVARTPALLTVT